MIDELVVIYEMKVCVGDFVKLLLMGCGFGCGIVELSGCLSGGCVGCLLWGSCLI